MSADQQPTAGRRWVTPVTYGVLGLELAVVVVFAATYNALDFRIYMWGGHAVRHHASMLYWEHLSHDTRRVGAAYISNQSPYGTAIRIAEGQGHIGAWWIVIPLAFAVIGLAAATILARKQDWLGATAVTGTTGLLVSPVSWAHHWVWILPALVLLVRSGHRIAAAFGYLLFALAPFWFTPHSGGPREYGFHWLLTLVANCFLIAGLAFLAYMAWYAYRSGGLAQLGRSQRPQGQAEDLGAVRTGPD